MTNINITIGRFGEKSKRLSVAKNSTLKTILKKANIGLSKSERIWIGGQRAPLTKKMNQSEIINIIGSKSGASY